VSNLINRKDEVKWPVVGDIFLASQIQILKKRTLFTKESSEFMPPSEIVLKNCIHRGCYQNCSLKEYYPK
jgi:predicted membrane-bound dolichyl-phosphate-mannose-protein mannosyltransferase